MADQPPSEIRVKLSQWMDSFAHVRRFNSDGILGENRLQARTGVSKSRAQQEIRRVFRDYVDYAQDKVIWYGENLTRSGKLQEIILFTYEPRRRIDESQPRVYPVTLVAADCRRFKGYPSTFVAYFSEHALCRIIERERCQSLAEVNSVVAHALQELWAARYNGWSPFFETILLTRDYFLPLAPVPGTAPVVKTYVPRTLWRQDQEEYFSQFILSMRDVAGERCRFVPPPPARKVLPVSSKHPASSVEK